MSTALLTNAATDDRAFERMYRSHVHEVYRYVLAVLRNQADAEDATQATFLSAYRAFTRGDEPLKPRNWLLKIAHNECRQRFRAASRRPKEVEWDDRTPAAPLDESIPTADEIRTALTHLSFNQRSALVMRELEGRTYAEIGAILELSGSAVETLLFRARRALREQLEGALSCGEAEVTLSKRLDGRISLAEQRLLRAHLRECSECATLERKQRARRVAVKRLGIGVQLPPSLASFLGGTGSVTGGAIAGSGLVAKAAAVMAAGVVAGGVGHEAVQAVAAEKPARTPLSEPRDQRQLQSNSSVFQKPGLAPGATSDTTGGSSKTSARRARNGVRKALRRGPGGPTETRSDAGSNTAPGGEANGSAPAVSVPVPGQGPVGVQPPAAPTPVTNTVESAREVVSQVPVPSIPPPPIAVPPVTVPPAPPLPTLPPPPPLPPPPLP